MYLMECFPCVVVLNLGMAYSLLLNEYLVSVIWKRSIIYFGQFLTARPWAERGSCFPHGFFFFRRFVCDQTQTSLGQTSNDATYGVYSCKEDIENLWG